MPYPAHVYLPALIAIYIAFFLSRTTPVWALVMPIVFFAINTMAIVAFYAKEKNLKKATMQFIFLLVVLSPIVFFAWRSHH